MNQIFLTFDLEEFDLPREHNIEIEKEKMYGVSLAGGRKILDLLSAHHIRSTFFVSAEFGNENREFIHKLSEAGHEIALHCYRHSDNYQEMGDEEAYLNIKNAKDILETITGKKIIGFRAPRMMPPPYTVLRKNNIIYDSSLHPTYVPGRYNNLRSPRKIEEKDGVKIVPVSTTPLVRLPFSWFWFRNFGPIYSEICTKLSLLDQDFVNLYFHPWEFIDIGSYEIPAMIKKNTGDAFIQSLEKYIHWCLSEELEFTTVASYVGEME